MSPKKNSSGEERNKCLNFLYVCVCVRDCKPIWPKDDSSLRVTRGVNEPRNRPRPSSAALIR